VLFINGSVGAIGTTEPGSIEDALSTGLQTVAWVVLWVPINLLIYDLWVCHEHGERGRCR
jgi:hypothetical protein